MTGVSSSSAVLEPSLGITHKVRMAPNLKPAPNTMRNRACRLLRCSTQSLAVAGPQLSFNPTASAISTERIDSCCRQSVFGRRSDPRRQLRSEWPECHCTVMVTVLLVIPLRLAVTLTVVPDMALVLTVALPLPWLRVSTVVFETVQVTCVVMSCCVLLPE